ncbi:FIG015287: Zinc protease [hydrothermal vent metagenome]|uniref:FIG015287: Zinc protease n=1 Tax=hydrothermal vent metagenome TaxID=652676 RepID=A0A3B0ZWZ8_9ZZZZ
MALRNLFLFLLIGFISVSCSKSEQGDDAAVVTSSQGEGIKIQTWQSSKGAKVMFVQAPQLPMIDIRLVFNAGSARDKAQLGIAQLTNTMLSQSAGQWSTDEIAERFEEVGANFSTSALRDMAIISLRSLTDEKLLAQAIATFKVVVSQPAFKLDEIKRQKAQQLIAIQNQLQSPGSIASKAFYAAIFKGHPYAQPTMGIKEIVSAISTENLKEFYKRYYVANNLTIAIVGNVDQKQAHALVEEITADLASGKAAEKLAELAMPEKAQQIHKEYAATQTHILVGQPGMKRGDDDYYSLYVGNHILGGSGFGSRIMQEIREKRGLAYSSYSYFAPMLAEGPFIMGLQTRNENTQQALEILDKLLRDFIEQGPTAEELSHSKKNITGGFPLRVDSNKDITEYLAVIGFYNLPLDYLSTFNDKVNAVTAEMIKDAFKRRIYPDKLITVTVGKANKK